MKKIRVGIIGLGRIGSMHLENIANLRDYYEIVALADPLNANLSELAEKYSISFYTKDPQELINKEEVDAVLISSASNTHSEMIQNAAEAGKNIFCEKPIGESVEAIKKSLEIVKKNKVKLQVGFNRRFDHNFRAIHDSVKSGKIGVPQIVRISSRDPEPPAIEYVKVSGGLFNDMMIHDVDMARYLTQSEVVEVYATGDSLIDPRIREAGDIDTAVVTLRFENGAFGIIDNSRKAVYGYDQRAEVFGSEGKISIDNDRMSNFELESNDGGHLDVIPRPFTIRYSQAYIDEFKEFYNSIVNGQDIKATGFDGLKAAELTNAAAKSLQTGLPVKIS